MKTMLECVPVMDEKQPPPPVNVSSHRPTVRTHESSAPSSEVPSTVNESIFQRKKREFLRLAPSKVEQEESDRLAYVPKGRSR